MAVQFIKRGRPGKPITWYVYAFKGGPRIMTHVGAHRPSLDAAASRNLAKALATRESPIPSDKFRSVIRAWLASPEWDRLAPQTKKLWRSHLDLIEQKWGDAPTAVWNDTRMKAKVVVWRNARKETPRAADIGVTVLHALLKWAALNGHGIAINAAAEIPRLYKGGNRQEIIWLPDDMDRFVATANKIGRPWIGDALRLASLTGLRVADLATVTFDQVGEAAIEKVALKRSGGKRRRVTIPVTTALERLVEELRLRKRETGVNTLLVNSYGRAWTPSGLTGSFNRIRDAARIVHVDEDGVERAKHLHDVRGTFCTFLLVECGLTDEEAADIMGWSKDRVDSIRRVYVDDGARVMALAQRIAAKQKAKQAAQ